MPLVNDFVDKAISHRLSGHRVLFQCRKAGGLESGLNLAELVTSEIKFGISGPTRQFRVSVRINHQTIVRADNAACASIVYGGRLRRGRRRGRTRSQSKCKDRQVK